METIYDVVVIGGGTNGPLIALTLLTSGFTSVALVEKGLIGRGREGRAANYAATGMIQPGSRYIGSDRSIVYTDAIDCRSLRRLAGDLLTETAFVIPTFPDYPFPYREPLALDMYFGVYDYYSRIALHKPHQRLTREELRKFEPALKRGATGGVCFSEWLVDPVRLVQAITAEAQKRGLAVFEEHELTGFITRPDGWEHVVEAAEVKNAAGSISCIRGRYFVNACGAWTGQVAELLGIRVPMRLTQGTSIVVGRRLVEHGVILFDEHGHYATMIPHGATTVIGPTNVDVSETVAANPDLARPSQCEIAYLRDIANRYLARPISEKDIAGTKCGLRPQLDEHWMLPYGATHQFAIFNHRFDGVRNTLSIIGGKLSSMVRMAQEAAAEVRAEQGVKFVPGMQGLVLAGAGDAHAPIERRHYRKSRGLRLSGATADAAAQKIYLSSLVKKDVARAHLAYHATMYLLRRKWRRV